MVYLDDVIVFSDKPEQHIEDVAAVIRLLHNAGMTLKLNKCFFMHETIEYRSPFGASRCVQNSRGRQRVTTPSYEDAVTIFLGYVQCLPQVCQRLRTDRTSPHVATQEGSSRQLAIIGRKGNGGVPRIEECPHITTSLDITSERQALCTRHRRESDPIRGRPPTTVR